MLELRDVHTHYGLSHVLQGIDLRVEPGEVVGLFGRNGVGKTTVMKTIAGWVQPSQGDIHFESRPLAGIPAAAATSDSPRMAPASASSAREKRSA